MVGGGNVRKYTVVLFLVLGLPDKVVSADQVCL